MDCLELTAGGSVKTDLEETTSELVESSRETEAPGFVGFGRFLRGDDLSNFQAKTTAMANPAKAPSDPAP